MSTQETLATQVDLLVEQQLLFKLEPLVADELTYVRSVWVTAEVLDAINYPEDESHTSERHEAFGATLDAFINWEEIGVSENPFDKDRNTFLARVDPVERQLWDIRTTEPPQGMRCIGAFIGCDEFVGLVWDYRENYNVGEFDKLVERGNAEWQRLFATLTPHSGGNLDAYLTKYFNAGA